MSSDQKFTNIASTGQVKTISGGSVNLGPCRITYIARITDTEQFDSLLSNAIAYRLASETAYAITGSTTVAQSMYTMYEQKVREARAMDALEGKPDKLVADEFTNIRL